MTKAYRKDGVWVHTKLDNTLNIAVGLGCAIDNMTKAEFVAACVRKVVEARGFYDLAKKELERADAKYDY